MKKNIPFIKIDSAIIDLVLPKCNIVFGNSFSSVYLQLILNINNNLKDVEWKQNKCWIGTKTISKNVNCNERKVMKLLNEMQEIGLIKKEYKGKLYMFSLCNKDFSNMQTFNRQLDNNLLKYVKDENKTKVANKLSLINNLFKKNEQYFYSNLCELRQWMILSEQIKAGSSLMFLMMFAENFINDINSTFVSLSESRLAEKLGTSQSTINRVLNSFEKSKCFHVDYDKRKKKTIIHLNRELIKMNKEEIKDVITTINTDEVVYKCPICNKEVTSIKKLNNHIKRCKDELHTIFCSLQNKHNAFTINEIEEIYKEHRQIFDDIVNRKEAEKKKTNSSAMQLVKYFYSLTNTRCPNWAKEMNLIKSHLIHGLQPDEIMETMRYMSKRSYQDLRFFNNSINDALTIRQCKLEVKTPGTDAYLVRLYFSKMGQSLNDRLMLQGIRKINELRQSNYNQQQIETIVDYMIEKRCPNFNFIVNIANEALSNSKNKSEMAKAYTTNELVRVALDGVLEYGVIMMKDNNYDMAKREIIIRLKEDLCAGRVDLTRVNKTYNKFAVELAKEIYKRNLYENKFTPQQSISTINLNVVNLDLQTN